MRRASRAFTLIELVITLSILLVIGGVCGIKLKGVIQEHTFSTQASLVERVFKRGYNMAHFLDTDITATLSLTRQGCLIKLAGLSVDIDKLAGEEKMFGSIKQIKLNGKIESDIKLIFSNKRSEETRVIEIGRAHV